MSAITALFAGLLFSAGLMVSGMANPAKVQNFLDLAGRWDPSLAFVMAGAIAIGSLAFLIAQRRKRSFLGLPVQLPASADVTLRLVLGSAAFGVGWGLAGFCPGPALVALGAGYPKAIGFVAAMVAGMGLFEIFERVKLRTTQRPQ
ncbi:YeeE/YedE family protein [Duganella violaceipulchra]|uniref:Membrane protein YedE/YeeE n=1 Tax=Duganella violaceipulchra TaxID=2849652 RepID=A0AA41L189_9BURK|nr:YeeE/YedE family protein [Duganella violaceicalia]MBV6324386.1 YeeE/YedE family protein [Duganella violaceicalia]MCP2011989.1 putative membrane protein YedE/YeeE [Duganella violaceicalia]